VGARRTGTGTGTGTRRGRQSPPWEDSPGAGDERDGATKREVENESSGSSVRRVGVWAGAGEGAG
jgi:hypothetical protein